MISAARRSNIDGRSRKSNREWPVPSGSNPLRVVFYCRVSTDDQRDAVDVFFLVNQQLVVPGDFDRPLVLAVG